MVVSLKEVKKVKAVVYRWNCKACPKQCEDVNLEVTMNQANIHIRNKHLKTMVSGVVS